MINALSGLNTAQRECMSGLAERLEFLQRQLESLEDEMENSEEVEMYRIDIYNALFRSYSNGVTVLFDAIPKDGA